jgi:outer membrane protein TolC
MPLAREGWTQYHRTGALGVLVLLAGCTKVGPDFVKPDAPIADGWTEAGELQLNATQTDHTDWWKAFDDLVLDIV